MPSLRAFWDQNQGALTGWNRMLAAGGTISPAVNEAGDNISGVTLVVPAFTAFNSTAGPASTSGDAAWITPSTHFADAISLSAVDTWFNHVITGLGSTPHTIEVFGYSQPATTNRFLQARVNGGTAQVMATPGNGTNVLRFENITPVSGEITISVARHSTSVGGNTYGTAFRIYEFVAEASMTITTDGGEIRAGEPFNVLCEDFGAAPDGDTFAVNTLVDGVAVSSLPIAVTVTDNMDGTYDLDGTAPSLPVSGSAASARFTDAAAGITHTISIDTV